MSRVATNTLRRHLMSVDWSRRAPPMESSQNVLEALRGGSSTGTTAQAERRKRIIDATIALASKGGYDAVQMRAVAEKADVALGTLYRYFPSKIHLLVVGLAREFAREQEKMDRSK